VRPKKDTYDAVLADLFGESREPHAARNHLPHRHLVHRLRLCHLPLLWRLLLLLCLRLRLSLPWHLLLGHLTRLLLQ
jgi:hypothetical protein